MNTDYVISANSFIQAIKLFDSEVLRGTFH